MGVLPNPAESVTRRLGRKCDPSLENFTNQPMPRRKFRHSQRSDPTGDRSHQEYLLQQGVQLTTRSEILRLIRGGEDTYLELKVKLSNPEKIAQGIVALANTGGGTIVFGVSDQLRVEGLNDPGGVRDVLEGAADVGAPAPAERTVPWSRRDGPLLASARASPSCAPGERSARSHPRSGSRS